MMQSQERTKPPRSPVKTRVARTLLLVALLLLLPCTSNALTNHGILSNVEFTVYAPDWTWQDREVNILVVLRRTDDRPKSVNLSLVFPPGKAGDFAYKGKTEINAVLEDGKRVRSAFVGIKPLGRAPRQIYPFQLRIRAGGNEAVIDYPLRTIRGAVVNPGKFAVILPAGLAAAWCLVLLVALTKMAAHGAWLRPSEPVSEPEAPDEWITRNPV